jgi:surface antigen
MRIAVLTGVFACAVIFAVSSNKADAATLQLNEASVSNDTIVRMVAVTEKSKSPLLEIVEEELENETKNENQENIKQDEPVKHVVGENESLVIIAEIHKTQWKRIYDKNTQIENPDVINVGDELIIPSEDEVLEPREIIVEIPEPVVRNSNSSSVSRNSSNEVKSSTVSRVSSDGNRYVAGYCTWYVKNRRPDLPNNLGNASTWVSRAAAQGFATGSTPRVGAVGQQGNHVVYIESVNADGTVTVSDMNWSGLYVVTTRTVPASNFKYIY